MPTRKTSPAGEGGGRRAEPVGPVHTPHTATGTTLDAMGKDKRRQVIGHSYGPSRRQQLGFFAIVGMVAVLIYFGVKLLTSQFDTAPANNPAVAPWSRADAPQTPPARPF